MTPALPTPSAQANHDALIRLPIESDKGPSVPSSNVSEIVVSENSESYRTSDDDADRSAAASPPSEQDYAANMLRSPVTYQWNDSGDVDDDQLFQHSLRKICILEVTTSSEFALSVDEVCLHENKKHRYSIP